MNIPAVRARPVLPLANVCCPPLLREPLTASQAADLARTLKALADPTACGRASGSQPAVDVRRLARDERADLAALLATLSPQQRQAPTLCPGWRVRDVVAHVISYDDLDARSLLAHVIQHRFRPQSGQRRAGQIRQAQPERGP